MNKSILGLVTMLTACTSCPPDPHVLSGESGTLYGREAIEAVVNIDKTSTVRRHCVYIPPEKCEPRTLDQCIGMHKYIYMSNQPGFWSCPDSYDEMKKIIIPPHVPVRVNEKFRSNGTTHIENIENRQ